MSATKKVDLSIISSGASLSDARLHRITNALIKSGISVEVLAPGNEEDAPSGAIIRKVQQGKGFKWRLHRAFYSPWQAEGSLLYCIAPEAQLFTWLSARLRGRTFGADVYEDYLSLLRDRAWAKKFGGLPGLLGNLIAKCGTFFTSRADFTTVADVQVPPFQSKRRILLRNLPDRAHLTPSGARSSTPRAIYIGDVRKSRGLHTMLDAIVIAREWHLDIVGPIAQADRNWVDQWISQNSEAASRVTFHGRLSPINSWRLVEGAWAGLSLLEPTPAFTAAIPSKLYEYMAVGLATISTSLPRSAELIATSHGGEVADTPEHVASLLSDWVAHPNKLDQMRSAAKNWADANLNADSEYGAMVEAVRDLLDSKLPR